MPLGLRRARPGKQLSLTTSQQQQFPADDDDDDDDDQSRSSAAADTAAAASAAETALASMLRTSCTIIDMGSYLLSERGSRPYNADDAALPPIPGEHVRQILPEALVERAGLFPPFDPSRQVAPSFFDAPGAQESMPSSASNGLVTASSVASVSPANSRRFSADLPNITFAFASEVGYKEVVRLDKQQGLIALGRFKSCVRTSLLLCGGYECQEKEGTFMMAFPHPRAAVEWALTLQLALLRLPWGEGLLGLAPTQEDRSPVTGQLLFRGLSAKVGIFHGPIVKLCPHSTTGRADYFGTPVNRAARFWAGCNAGQILIEKSAIAAVGAEWAGAAAEGLPGPAPAASVSAIAARNHALLTKRMQTEQSFPLSAPSSSSGKSSGLKRTVTIQPNASGKSHMGDSGLPAVYVSDETGCLSPVSVGGPRSARRSADMSAQFRAVKSIDAPMFSPLSRDSGSEANRDWDAKMEEKAGGKMHQVPAMNDSSAQAQRVSDEGISKTRTKSFSDTQRIGAHTELTTAALKLPSTSMKAEVYHVGQFSFKGIQEATDVCQVLPASLSERRDSYKDVSANTNGKAVCLEQNDSFYFAAQLQLPNVFHLPLAAEPPLYINVVRAEFQSFTGMRSGNPRVTRAS